MLRRAGLGLGQGKDVAGSSWLVRAAESGFFLSSQMQVCRLEAGEAPSVQVQARAGYERVQPAVGGVGLLS